MRANSSGNSDEGEYGLLIGLSAGICAKMAQTFRPGFCSLFPPKLQYETIRRMNVRKIWMMAAMAALMLAAGLSLNVGRVSAADAMPAVGGTAPGFTLPSQTGSAGIAFEFRRQVGGALFLPEGYDARLHG